MQPVSRGNKNIKLKSDSSVQSFSPAHLGKIYPFTFMALLLSIISHIMKHLITCQVFYLTRQVLNFSVINMIQLPQTHHRTLFPRSELLDFFFNCFKVPLLSFDRHQPHSVSHDLRTWHTRTSEWSIRADNVGQGG